jgi:hypothetical protein
MENYSFYLDRKVTMWRRETFTIRAETENQATLMAINSIRNGNIDDHNPDYEELWDTCEEMAVRDNNHQATEELFVGGQRLGGKSIWNNTEDRNTINNN